MLPCLPRPRLGKARASEEAARLRTSVSQQGRGSDNLQIREEVGSHLPLRRVGQKNKGPFVWKYQQGLEHTRGWEWPGGEGHWGCPLLSTLGAGAALSCPHVPSTSGPWKESMRLHSTSGPPDMNSVSQKTAVLSLDHMSTSVCGGGVGGTTLRESSL